MYLKVYYNPQGKLASIQEVQAALPQDMHGLTVDDDLNYCSVEFPDKAGIPELIKVKTALQRVGFETE